MIREINGASRRGNLEVVDLLEASIVPIYLTNGREIISSLMCSATAGKSILLINSSTIISHLVTILQSCMVLIFGIGWSLSPGGDNILNIPTIVVVRWWVSASICFYQ